SEISEVTGGLGAIGGAFIAEHVAHIGLEVGKTLLAIHLYQLGTHDVGHLRESRGDEGTLITNEPDQPVLDVEVVLALEVEEMLVRIEVTGDLPVLWEVSHAASSPFAKASRAMRSACRNTPPGASSIW